MGWAKEVSVGGVGGVGRAEANWRVSPEHGGGERRKVFAVWECFSGCCDAGDVIDSH